MPQAVLCFGSLSLKNLVGTGCVEVVAFRHTCGIRVGDEGEALQVGSGTSCVFGVA